jgi:hypothetical protein
VIHALALGALLAQLSPTVGEPLSGGATQTSGETVLVKLPSSFGMYQRVVAHHGTEIYALQEWKTICPIPHVKKPHVEYVDGVLSVERTGLQYDMRTISDEREFALGCHMFPMHGRFTLILADPGHPKSPALAARTPDFVVP